LVIKLPRYTPAYSSLITRLTEVERLAKKARELERTDPFSNTPLINGLCRGGAVLLSSHIEGYTKEVGEITLSRIFEQQVCRSRVTKVVSYYASQDLIEGIKNTSDREKIAEKIVELISRDLTLWESRAASR